MIEDIVITSLCINFIWLLFNVEDMLFYNLGVWLKSNLPDAMLQPVISCVACMASIWGTIGYLHRWNSPLEWVIFILAVGGTNIILHRIWTLEYQ